MKTITKKIIKSFFIVCSFICILETSAQTPNKMSYQAVVRNASNALIVNANVGIQISILQTTIAGTAIFVERHTVTTNSNGLATLEIGSGTAVTGTLETVNWANGPYFIKTETDPNGGTNYTISGTSQLLSVPYALQAKKAEIADDVQGVKMFYYIITQGLIPELNSELNGTIGTIIAHAGFNPLPPSPNYKLCDGSLLPINASNSFLFQVIGNTYGGSLNQLTMAVPNLMGKVIKGN